MRAALELVEPGMRLGLGSGRAVWGIARGLGGNAVRPELVVCASPETAGLVAASGIPVVSPEESPELDLALDGADEVTRELAVLKGGGGALLREKLVIESAARCVIVAETDKLVMRLGEGRRLPVEVVRFGWEGTRARLLHVVADAGRRSAPGDSPFVTDEGHFLLDCALPRGVDLAALATAVKAVTGVVEHGLFLQHAQAALLGAPDGTLERLVRS